MPRRELLKGRISLTNQVYHVTICTKNRETYFNDFECGRILVNQVKHFHHSKMVLSMAWVVMPDHFHWLFKLENTLSLSGLIKRLKARSAIDINRYQGNIGSVWQRGFYDHAVRKEENIRQVARYIIANPLREGLVESIGDYPLWDCIWL